MQRRHRRRVRIEQLGEHKEPGRGRAALVVTVPVLSLLLPAIAVVIANSGGTSAPVRISADVERFLLFYSGVFALLALTATVGAGLLAADGVLRSPEFRIRAQALHRMAALVALSALANHIMLEILAHRVSLIDGFVPFLAVRRTFFMGLGTLASDLFVVIIITGIMRARFATGARRWLWRAAHSTAYAAWPLAILHGLLAGRPAKPYVDWSYGGCLALVGLALTLRIVMRSRRGAGPAGLTDRTFSPLAPQPPIAQDFVRLTGSRARPRPLPALQAGQSAHAPPARRPAPSAWPLPEYDVERPPPTWRYGRREG
jgi:hypothetical protein